MFTKVFVREFVALAQMHEGFNYRIEAGARLEDTGTEAKLREALRLELAKIDHRALGVDVHLGFEPTSLNLARWLKERLEERGVFRDLEFIFRRGDGACIRA